jgi:hypothetical protein
MTHQQQAYINGFVKRASQYGFTTNEALALLKHSEELKGDQHKLDVDHDGKIEAEDLKKLRNRKKASLFTHRKQAGDVGAMTMPGTMDTNIWQTLFGKKSATGTPTGGAATGGGVMGAKGTAAGVGTGAAGTATVGGGTGAGAPSQGTLNERINRFMGVNNPNTSGTRYSPPGAYSNVLGK